MMRHRIAVALCAICLPSAALALTGGTNITITNGTVAISGQVAVANGGTGASTLTAHGVVMGNGTSAVQISAAGTSGQPFLSGGAGAPGAYGALNVSTAAVTGTLALTNGGTGAASFTGSRCIRSNSGGTALEVASGDCGIPLGPIENASTLGDITAGTTVHVGPGTVDATQGRAQTIAPTALSVDNLRCVSSAAPGTSESFVITMADAACTGALTDSSAQVCTISGTNRSCVEAGAAEAVSAGACYAFKVVASASAATAVVTCGWERSA